MSNKEKSFGNTAIDKPNQNFCHSELDSESSKILSEQECKSIKVKIKEIFASIQGEGPYVGYKQLFIRFCGCNLKCNYCDTEFSDKNDYKEFSALELAEEVRKYSDIHSISLTGGEPLLSADFLKEFLPLIYEQPPLLKGGGPRSGGGILPKIYLETNATLVEKFLEIKPYIDIVSADIKLESATGLKNTFQYHDKFFEACQGIETFAKIVFNEKITDDEILKCCELGKKYEIELILQPEMVTEGRKFEGQVGKPFTCHYEEGNSLPDEVIQHIDTDINKKLDCFANARNDDTVTLPEQPETYNHSTVQQFNRSTENGLFAYSPISLFAVKPEFTEQILDKFLQHYDKVRLIPQVHKFLNLR